MAVWRFIDSHTKGRPTVSDRRPLEKVVTAAVQSKTAAGCRGWTSDSGQAAEKKASSLFSMAWYAHIRTCPTVVTSGMTGSEQSFAALYLDALAEWS
jgi:hypothetical protein